MKTDRPAEVTVIVVNWNRRDLLRRCLASLCEQRDAAFEVIVVDNGSVDGSAEMVRSEFDRPGGPRVSLVVNESNRGFCAANNQGFARARTPFVALLNNDAEAGAEWLASLRAAFEQGPDIGMAASKILVWEDPARIDKAGHLIYPDGQNRGRGSGQLDQGQFDRCEEVLWPDGCAAMYRRAMIDQIGGFDEDFFAYADDAELGLRGRIAGWRCLYVPRAVVRHHRGATLGVASLRRLSLIERNRVLLAAKLFPWSLLWLNPAYYLARLTAGLWAALRSRGEIRRYREAVGLPQTALAMIRGDLEALAMLPRMLAKRKETARYRTLTPRQVRQLILAHRISLRELSEQSN